MGLELFFGTGFGRVAEQIAVSQESRRRAPDQVARDVVALCKTMQGLAGKILLRDLPFELDAVGSVFCHGFHPSKARDAGQFVPLQPSGPRGPLQSGVKLHAETHYLEDRRLELDINPVENQIRPIALKRKNALFADHEVGAENWAMLASLIATCKMSDVNPINYFARTLRTILDGHPRNRIEALMPWRYDRSSSLAA
jgi:hypothetical protein